MFRSYIPAEINQALDSLVAVDPEAIRILATYGGAALTAIGALVVAWRALRVAWVTVFGGARLAWWAGGAAVGLGGWLLRRKAAELREPAASILAALGDQRHVFLDGDALIAGPVRIDPECCFDFHAKINGKSCWNLLNRRERRAIRHKASKVFARLRDLADARERVRLASVVQSEKPPATWTMGGWAAPLPSEGDEDGEATPEALSANPDCKNMAAAVKTGSAKVRLDGGLTRGEPQPPWLKTKQA